MATVKTRAVRLFTGEDFKIKVRFSPEKSQDFKIDLPAGYKEVFHEDEVEGKTIKEAEDKFWKLMEKWEQAKTTERKVIIYFWRYNQTRDTKEEKNQQVKRDMNCSSGPEPGNAFGFEYEVCTEISTGNQTRYITREENKEYDPKSEFSHYREKFHEQTAEYDYEARQNKRDKTVVVIDWTEEREKLFAGIKGGLRAMVKKVKQFDKEMKDEKNLDEKANAYLKGAAVLSLPPAEKK